ncbi:myophilin-like isoform X1 [Diadema antillarum]|uniref:myophilin-like isoform X1 n=1 Tax=Diadema antillarum TaxID=105358 RepID=UPI003A8531EB
MAFQAAPMGDARKTAMKIESKRDPELEKQCCEFIEFHTGEKVNAYDDLKNGVILCKLVNTFSPGAVKKCEASSAVFKQRANLEAFINGCKIFGLKDQEVFQVNDLFEGKNLPQFTQCIIALARYAQSQPGYNGPMLGPKQSEENVREFTQDQLDAGKHMIGLQMGSNKGASQAGGDFGRPRQVHQEFK